MHGTASFWGPVATELAPECAREDKARSDWRRYGGNKAEIKGQRGCGCRGAVSAARGTLAL